VDSEKVFASVGGKYCPTLASLGPKFNNPSGKDNSSVSIDPGVRMFLGANGSDMLKAYVRSDYLEPF